MRNSERPKPWPSGLPLDYRPWAKVTPPTPEETLRYGRHDPRRFDRERKLCLSTFGTNTWAECFFASTANGTAVASTASETSYLTGLNAQPKISPPTWDTVPGAAGRVLIFEGEGYFSTTGTPTMTFFCRLSPTQGATTLSGTAIGQSAAVTTGSGVSNKLFGFQPRTICRATGEGTGNATLYAAGYVESPAGFASPFRYSLTPGGGDGTTVTATIDGSLTQFFNFSQTWSASSSSNTTTLTARRAFGW